MKEQSFTVRIKTNTEFSEADILSALKCSVNISFNTDGVTVSPAESSFREVMEWCFDNNDKIAKLSESFGNLPTNEITDKILELFEKENGCE